MKKLYIFLGIFLAISFSIVIVNLLLSVQKNTAPSQTQRPTSPTEIKRDYNSNLNKTVPGKSNISDVIKINGTPSSRKKIGSKDYLYFKTPIDVFNNVVVFDNGIEVFATENVFGDYRGTYDSFMKAYGKPNLTLHDNISPFVWKIFLQQGVGVQTNGTDITQVVYFVPQEEDSFMQNVGKDLGLSKETPKPESLSP